MRFLSRLLRPANPFATVHGVIDVLERQADARNDMTALGKLREARKTITRECLKGASR